jgi:hypothetical protein
MRRIAPALTLAILVAGCARAPQPEAALPPPVAAAPQPPERGSVIGMTAAELVSHFGNPALQVREGNSLKLQFRSPGCVLDAYLYRSPRGGAQRVTHVDARLSSGADTDAQRCADQMARGS